MSPPVRCGYTPPSATLSSTKKSTSSSNTTMDSNSNDMVSSSNSSSSLAPSPLKKSSTISFAPKILIFRYEVEWCDNYPNDDHVRKPAEENKTENESESTTKALLWYTRDDYLNMRTDDRMTIAIMTASSSNKVTTNYDVNNDEEVYCFRGLEYRSPEGLNRRRENKSQAMSAVLTEQDRQFSEKECNPDMLALRYRQSCYHTALEARARGQKDASAAFKILDRKRNENGLALQKTSSSNTTSRSCIKQKASNPKKKNNSNETLVLLGKKRLFDKQQQNLDSYPFHNVIGGSIAI